MVKEGQSYKRKNAINSDAFIVSVVDGSYVSFTNGARCKLETLESDFELFDGSINESNNVNEENYQISVDDAFIKGTGGVSDELLNKLESVIKNPHSSTGTRRESIEAGKGNFGKVINDEANPNNNNTDKSGTLSTHIANPNDIANRLSDEPVINNTQRLPVNENVVQHKPSNRLPEWDVFDRVKKSEEITINLPIKIKLPYARKIDALNDMFESSFVAYLAKQYIDDNLVKQSKGIQVQLQKEIEAWMDSELRDTKKQKKQKKEDKVVKASPKNGDNKDAGSNAAAVSDPVGDALRGKQNQPKWDGNLGTLSIISSQEQLDAVKKRCEYLKDVERSSDLDKELDRLEDMLITHNANNPNT